jgi:hypothetical protein
MNSLAFILNQISKSGLYTDELDQLAELVKSLVYAESPTLDGAATEVTASSNPEASLITIDIRLYYDWVRPDHAIGLSFVVDPKINLWHAHMRIISDSTGEEVPEWGSVVCGVKAFSLKDKPVTMMLAELRKQYEERSLRKKQSNDGIDRAKAALKDIQPLAEKIVEICKYRKVMLFIDRNIEAGTGIRILPESVTIDYYEDSDSPALDPGAFPEINLDIRGFDSNYDRLIDP